MTWSPWAELAAHPDILLHRCRLDDGDGWWCPQERVILLDDRLDRRRARCVLAHELAHALLDHAGCPPGYAQRGWLARRQEVHADSWAIRRLVPLGRLAEVLAERPDVEAAAAALDVTSAVLAWRLDRLEAGEEAVLRARLARREDAA